LTFLVRRSGSWYTEKQREAAGGRAKLRRKAIPPPQIPSGLKPVLVFPGIRARTICLHVTFFVDGCYRLVYHTCGFFD
jgi:hypothetical protein